MVRVNALPPDGLAIRIADDNHDAFAHHEVPTSFPRTGERTNPPARMSFISLSLRGSSSSPGLVHFCFFLFDGKSRSSIFLLLIELSSISSDEIDSKSTLILMFWTQLILQKLLHEQIYRDCIIGLQQFFQISCLIF